MNSKIKNTLTSEREIADTGIEIRGISHRVSAYLLLAIIALLTYLPVLQAGFIYDDTEGIVNNPLLRSLRGLREIWFSPSSIPLEHYWPLTFTSFWLEYQLWGARPMGYHLNNLLLHTANALLLLAILRFLALPGAWLAAALFAVHPIQVESVAWAIERKNVLSGTFVFLATLLYFRSLDRRTITSLAAVAALFLCGMLSKTLAIALPLALPLLHWWRSHKLGKPWWSCISALLLISLFTGSMHLYFYASATGASTLTWVERILVGSRAIWFYLAKLIWPAGLMPMYPRWNIHPAAAIQWVPIAGIICATIAFWIMRKRGGKGPLVAGAWFVLLLLPVLNLIDQPGFTVLTFVNDHAVYFACAGPFALLSCAAVHVVRFLPVQMHRYTWIGAAIMLAVLAVMSWQSSRYFQSKEAYYTHAIQLNPNAWRAHYNLAHDLLERNQFQRAEAHFRTTIELQPRHAGAYTGLGVCLYRGGHHGEAETAWNQAVRMDAAQTVALLNLSLLAEQRGHWNDAAELARRVFEHEPNNANALARAGVALFNLNEFDKAVRYLENAQTHDPNDARIRHMLGLALAREGKTHQAITQFMAASQLNPRNAESFMQLAVNYDRLGDTTQALTSLQNALELDSNNPKRYYAASLLANKAKDTDLVVRYLEEAVRLKPDFVQALTNLAWIRATSGKQELRDEKQALALATRANDLTQPPEASVLETLAAAHAAIGDFDKAVTVQKQAIETADKNGANWHASAQKRLDLYLAKKPYRE